MINCIPITLTDGGIFLDFSNEPDRIKRGELMRKLAEETDWEPGKQHGYKHPLYLSYIKREILKKLGFSEDDIFDEVIPTNILEVSKILQKKITESDLSISDICSLFDINEEEFLIIIYGDFTSNKKVTEDIFNLLSVKYDF